MSLLYAPARAGRSTGPPQGDDRGTRLIVQVPDADSLSKLKIMCSKNVLSYMWHSLGTGLGRHCHMPDLCRWTYSRTVLGAAGRVTATQLEHLKDCIPGVAHEEDAQVFRADDDAFWRPADLQDRLDLMREVAEKHMPHHNPRQMMEVETEAGERSSSQEQPRPPSTELGRVPAKEEGQRRKLLPTLESASTPWEDAAAVLWGLPALAPAPAPAKAARDPRPAPSAGAPCGSSAQQSLAGLDDWSWPLLNGTKDVHEPLRAHRVTGGLPLGARATKAERVGPELWSLDRVDQRALPLDGYFKYGGSSAAATGEGVTIYVVDSGINVNHQEFQPYGGGPSRASYGYDFVDEDAEASDCDGHGTHVAASAVGLGVGVAKAAKVVAVRILDCSGSGSVTTTVAALDWVAAHAVKPAVVTLSLGISVGSWSKTLEDAARNLILDYGIPIVVASGNSGVDACYVAPANVPQVITVGGSDVAHKNVSMAALVGQRTLAPPAKSVSDSLEGSLVAQSVEAPSQLASLQAEQAGALELASLVECQAGLSSGADGPASALSQQRDTLYRWSNTGSCVDLFAPGVDVYSACGGERRCDAVGPHSYSLLSGTSMAVPQVAGLVAQFMQYRPEASPEEIHAAVVEGATQGVLDESLFEKGTPNRLLHTRIFPDEEEVQAAQGP